MCKRDGGPPAGQHEIAASPIFDRRDLGPGYAEFDGIFADYEVAYSPGSYGVWYRIGWSLSLLHI